MSQLLPNGKQQFIDINGKPLVGGTVTTYLVGTSTPNPTWQDPAQTILNTNPVVLDARGQCVMYGTGSFRQVVNDVASNLIWDQVVTDPGGTLSAGLSNTIDPTQGVSLIPTADRIVLNITTLRTLPKTGGSVEAFVQGYYAKGDGGGGTYYLDPADTTTADNGGSVIVASDGGRWKLTQAQNISIRQFGAKGDGTTDDTVAIQNTLNNFSSIFLPPGNFLFSNLTVAKPIDIVGSGVSCTTLTCSTTTGNGISISSSSSRIFRVNLRNFCITYSGIATSGSALYLNNIGQGAIRDLMITGGAAGVGPFNGLFLNNVTQFPFDNIQVNNVLADGIHIDGNCTDLYLSNSRSDANGLNGVLITNSQGIYCSNVSAYSNTGSGWKIAYGGTNPNINMFFVNCVGDSSQSANWLITDLVRGYFANCWGNTQKNAVNTFVSGFLASKDPSGSLSRLEFVNCVANNNNAHGFSFTGGQYIHMANCLAEANGVAQTGHGIAIATTTDVNIITSRLMSNTGNGLNVGASCTNCVISNSSTIFNTGPLQILSASSDIIIKTVAGFKNSAVGSSFIASGSTSVAVTHGLAITPVPGKISTTQTLGTTNDTGNVWISAIGATTFTVNVRLDPGASGFQFNWAVAD